MLCLPTCDLLVKFTQQKWICVHTETQRWSKCLYTDSQFRETDVITCKRWLWVHRQRAENKMHTDCRKRAAVRQSKDTAGHICQENSPPVIREKGWSSILKLLLQNRFSLVPVTFRCVLIDFSFKSPALTCCGLAVLH